VKTVSRLGRGIRPASVDVPWLLEVQIVPYVDEKRPAVNPQKTAATKLNTKSALLKWCRCERSDLRKDVLEAALSSLSVIASSEFAVTN